MSATAVPAGRAGAVASGAGRARRVRLRRVLLAGAVAVALGMAAVAALRASGAFGVEAVRVRGVSGPAAEAVRREASALVDGRGLLALDADALARGLEALPTVHDARVDRVFPHTLAVRVVPETPAAAVVSGDEALTVARSGRVVSRGPAARRPRGLPLLAAPALAERPGDRVDHPAVRQELALVNAVPGTYGLRLATVQAGPDGLVARTARRRIEIRFGEPSDLRAKLLAAQAVAAAAPDAEVIDVSVPSLPAVQGEVRDEATLVGQVPGDENPGAVAGPADPGAAVADLFLRASH